MGLPARHRRRTIEEYLRFERDSTDKHEFHDGEILAMSGGSPAHSLISSNVGAALKLRLRGRQCRVYDANLRIRIWNESRYLYADASVVCGPLEFDPADSKRETVINPKVVIEVHSPSTERYDRTAKFDLYRRLPSLEEYVLVWQDQPRVEVFRRQPDGSWLFAVASGTDAAATLSSVEVELPVADVYEGVEFPPATEDAVPSPSQSSDTA